MKYLFGLCLLVLVASCSKNETPCIAKASDGTELFTVDGYEKCLEQISEEDGEYCDCGK